MNNNAVHFAQSLRYQPFNGTDFDFHEIIVGPLNAGPFNRPDLDESFSPERLFYYAPEGGAPFGFVCLVRGVLRLLLVVGVVLLCVFCDEGSLCLCWHGRVRETVFFSLCFHSWPW